MPDRQDDLNPASDLAPFADALKRLAPQPPHLSRDALLFEAGKAAVAPRLSPWVWPSATGMFAALSLVLLAFLASPGTVEVQYVDRTVHLNEPPKNPHSNPSSGQTPPSYSTAVDDIPAPLTQVKKTKAIEPSETARLMRQKRDVLRWGVDMLPESRPTAAGLSADVTATEVKHWLNLPPGTFALPSTLRKKPIPKDEDE